MVLLFKKNRHEMNQFKFGLKNQLLKEERTDNQVIEP